MRRALMLAMGAGVLSWQGQGAEPATASDGVATAIPLGVAPQAVDRRVLVVVTMLAATGSPAAALMSLRSEETGFVSPLGQMSPYPASFDTRSGDPSQQAEFDATTIVRKHPARMGWVLEIKLQSLTPARGLSAATQRFTAGFVLRP